MLSIGCDFHTRHRQNARLPGNATGQPPARTATRHFLIPCTPANSSSAQFSTVPCKVLKVSSVPCHPSASSMLVRTVVLQLRESNSSKKLGQ